MLCRLQILRKMTSLMVWTKNLKPANRHCLPQRQRKESVVTLTSRSTRRARGPKHPPSPPGRPSAAVAPTPAGRSSFEERTPLRRIIMSWMTDPVQRKFLRSSRLVHVWLLLRRFNILSCHRFLIFLGVEKMRHFTFFNFGFKWTTSLTFLWSYLIPYCTKQDHLTVCLLITAEKLIPQVKEFSQGVLTEVEGLAQLTLL